MRTFIFIFLVNVFVFCSCNNHAQQQDSIAVSDTTHKKEIVKDYPFENDIRKYEERDKDSFPKPGMVLFVGSSSIRLWKTLKNDMDGIPVLNRGFGSAITAHVLYFMDRIVIPYKPSVIVFYCGENDLGIGKQPTEILAQYREFIERVNKNLPQTRILMLSVKPSMRRSNQLALQKELNGLLEQLCNEYSFVEYVDVASPMMVNDTTVKNDIFLSDSLHMNQKGYAIWTEILRKKVEGEY